MEQLNLGDVIETKLQTQPYTLRCKLVTQAALDKGRELVAAGRWQRAADQSWSEESESNDGK